MNAIGSVGSGTSVRWPVGLTGKGNEGVAALVKRTPGAIGYVELTYAERDRIAYASIENAVGTFVTPSRASVTAAAAGSARTLPEDLRTSITNPAAEGAYPIAGFTYLLLYRNQEDPAKGVALARFLWWALHEGEAMAPDLFYVPLPPEVLARAEARARLLNRQGTPLLP